MATHTGIGFSRHHDPLIAFKEAAIEAKHQSGQASHHLALVFHTTEYLRQGTSEIVEKLLQPAGLLSVLTPGIILPGSIEARGVGILAIASDEIRFGMATKEELSFFPLQETGLRFSQELTTSLHGTQRQTLCLFFGSLQANSSLFLKGIQEGMGLAFPIFGGTSCDSNKISKSVVSQRGKQLHDAAAGILIGGKLSFTLSAKHGWVPLGRPRIVTESAGNSIHRIDNQPAITIYSDYFQEELSKCAPGKLGDIGTLYPLGLNTETPKEYLIRHAISLEPDGSILCQGDVPTGSRVHLMIGDKDSCRTAAHQAALEIKERLQGRKPKIVFIFQSVARRKLFGRGASQEITMIKEILGLTSNVFGMYTYGEIAPVSTDKRLARSDILGSTIAIAAIS